MATASYLPPLPSKNSYSKVTLSDLSFPPTIGEDFIVLEIDGDPDREDLEDFRYSFEPDDEFTFATGYWRFEGPFVLENDYLVTFTVLFREPDPYMSRVYAIDAVTGDIISNVLMLIVFFLD